jgi:hypothetical protein
MAHPAKARKEDTMPLTYRTITSALVHGHRRPTVSLSPNAAEVHDLGFGCRVTCSAWEGMYLDQGIPWAAENEGPTLSDCELEQFLAEITSGE